MTIAEALRCVAPPAAAESDTEAQVRADAFEVVYRELHRIARRHARPGIDAEDVASAVAVAIVAAGPREPGQSPATDAQAAAYLTVAVRNRLIDRHRAAKREQAEEDFDRFQGIVDPTGEADVEAQLALVQQAQQILYDEAVPAIARDAEGRFDRAGFVEAVQQMSALHRGTWTIDGLLTQAEGSVTASGRNRIYKQHERARTRLLSALPEWLEARCLEPLLDSVVRTLASTELAARVTRGGGA
jgi:DNA-directed RNA polymerase specialized sigma24 family protein